MERKRRKTWTYKKNAITKEQVLEAIANSGGLITTIARKLNCNWHTAKNYIEKWEETKQAYSDETQKFIDMCENVIYKAVKRGDVQTAKWVLSTRARDRGYGDKLEVEGNIIGNVNIIIKGE